MLSEMSSSPGRIQKHATSKVYTPQSLSGRVFDTPVQISTAKPDRFMWFDKCYDVTTLFRVSAFRNQSNKPGLDLEWGPETLHGDSAAGLVCFHRFDKLGICVRFHPSICFMLTPACSPTADSFCSACCRKIRYCSLFFPAASEKHCWALRQPLCSVPHYNDKDVIVTLTYRGGVCIVCACAFVSFSSLIQGNGFIHTMTRMDFSLLLSDTLAECLKRRIVE